MSTPPSIENIIRRVSDVNISASNPIHQDTPILPRPPQALTRAALPFYLAPRVVPPFQRAAARSPVDVLLEAVGIVNDPPPPPPAAFMVLDLETSSEEVTQVSSDAVLVQDAEGRPRRILRPLRLVALARQLVEERNAARASSPNLLVPDLPSEMAYHRSTRYRRQLAFRPSRFQSNDRADERVERTSDGGDEPRSSDGASYSSDDMIIMAPSDRPSKRLRSE